MTDAPGSPKASRLASPSWLDGRLVLGVLLVLVSVLVGAKVLAGADTSQQVWVASHQLEPGSVLQGSDLELGKAKLYSSSGSYLTGAKPVGYVVMRAVGAGELLPKDALSAPGKTLSRRYVTVPVAYGHLPPDLSGQDVVDVYVTPSDQAVQRSGKALSPLPREVLTDVTVSRVVKSGGLTSSGQTEPVVLTVDPAQVQALVVALSQGTIDLVRVPANDVPPAHEPDAGALMTQVPVLTAVSDAVWEARLVSALARGDLGVAVVRRCVDLADLLATAATGQARAVLLSADLRRLDRDGLTRLAVAGVAVVGLVPPGDEEAERRLRQLGVAHVLPSDASAETISAAVVEAVVALTPSPTDLSALADPSAALPNGPVALDDEPEVLPGTGRLVAVWGPTGAPGRTTVAVGLASELPGLGYRSLLVDADVYGGVVAQVLGLLDESPGLAAACRQANNGLLDVPALALLAREVAPSLRVLTGIARADRWTELKPAALEVVLDLATSLAAVTVIDCGFSLEQDEELSYDTMAPRRNGATLTVLERADTVLVVGTADPVGLQRLVRALSELREAVPGVQPRVVVNRLRSSAIPGNTEAEVRAALQRYAGVADLWVIPHDVAALDEALSVGKTLVESAPSSPVRQSLQGLAVSLLGMPSPARRRRLLRR